MNAVLPAIELVDLKVQGEGITSVDVIAHQALHGGVIIGSKMVDPRLLTCNMKALQLNITAYLLDLEPDSR
ncbi:MAG: hypothetical protein Ct9H300mP11_05920 [Chloroflexota bacterium]|nr:MAG: hypothetical protein Ct9H300mP11_05920 [Chloroflexota bacterium]